MELHYTHHGKGRPLVLIHGTQNELIDTPGPVTPADVRASPRHDSEAVS